MVCRKVALIIKLELLFSIYSGYTEMIELSLRESKPDEYPMSQLTNIQIVVFYFINYFPAIVPFIKKVVSLYIH